MRIFFIISSFLLIGCVDLKKNKDFFYYKSNYYTDNEVEECFFHYKKTVFFEDKKKEKKINKCEVYKNVRDDVVLFFNDNPIYLKSKDNAQTLWFKYQDLLNNKKNEKLSIYEILTIAHNDLIKEDEPNN